MRSQTNKHAKSIWCVTRCQVPRAGAQGLGNTATKSSGCGSGSSTEGVGCGMTSLKGPEVGRLSMPQGNSVPGRGPACAKALRKHLCLRRNRRSDWLGEGKRVVGEIKETGQDL